ncbi:MAG: hypothetical protein LBU85_04265 [Treponema sp.]|jgi:hypothetical protein|nr:hypothetical protein [Treponema sp.]
MKKLIAIAVVFALAAGVAFAADIGASVDGKIHVIEGTSKEDTEVMASGAFNVLRLETSGQNEEGTFGGWLRVDTLGISNVSVSADTAAYQKALTDYVANGGNLVNATNPQHGDYINPANFTKASGQLSGGFFGYAWWKPIEQLKLTIGVNPDGHFGTDGVTQWGFYQVAGDIVGNHASAWGGGIESAASGFVYRDAFFGGWASNGAIITVTPIEGLEVNVGIPFIAKAGRGENVYKSTTVQAAYNIDGIGRLALTWDGSTYGGKDAEKPLSGGGLGRLFAYFNLTSVENLSVDIGFGIPFASNNGKGPDPTDPTKEVDKSTFKMYAGLGAHYTAGSFGAKARLAMGFGGTTTDGKTASDAFKMMFDLMPYYAITDTLTAHLSFGMGFQGDSYYDGESRDDAPDFAAWHIYPYITVKGGWWAPNFYAGLKIESDKDSGFRKKTGYDKQIINWSVPVGIHFEF